MFKFIDPRMDGRSFIVAVRKTFRIEFFNYSLGAGLRRAQSSRFKPAAPTKKILSPMAKIVDLQSYRSRVIAEKVFGPWRRRFKETYDEKTGPADLSDRTLFLLAEPGDKSTHAFYELVMGALELGQASMFYYMDKGEQLKVVDVHLFLADQVRYELMHRLGWVASFPCRGLTFLELIQGADRLKLRGNPPQLAESHTDYDHFTGLTMMDKEAFIRRMLPKALEAFKESML